MRPIGNFLKIGRLAILLPLLLLSFASYTFGQTTIHISTPSGALPDGSAYPANAYSFTFTATGDLTGVAWQIIPPVGGLPAGLSFNAANGSISGTPAISAAGQTFSFQIQVTNTHDVNNGIVPDPATSFSIHIGRLPVDVMLVLDNSASMGCCYNQTPYDVTCETCATATDTRLKKLQAAIDKFITLGTTGATPYFHLTNANAAFNDRFGAVIFCGSLDNSHNTYVSKLSDLTTLDNYVQGLTTCGGTGMGGAVDAAVSSMVGQTTTNHTMSILLFTDGEQNYNPMLTTGSAPLTLVTPEASTNPYDPNAPNPPYGNTAPLPGTLPVFNQAFKTTSPGITINTIGFELPPGPGNDILAALADPANGAGGTTNTTMGGSSIGIDDFTMFFTNAFVQLLNGSSPQLVAELQGTTVAGPNNFPFTVNDSVRKVTFIVSGNAQTAETLNFRVLKDSVDVTMYGTMIHKSGFNLWNIDFPVHVPGVPPPPPSFKAGGHWVLQTIRTGAKIEYDATCVVDDHALNYQCSTGGTTQFVVGNAIPLSVRLKNRGGKMRNATPATIVVLIQHSSGDGGTSLAKFPVAKEIIGSQAVVDPGYNNLGQVKYYTLLQTTPQYRDTLGAGIDSVTLTLTSDSIYTGSYTPRVTGPHRFTFLIHGVDSTIGEFYRTQTQSGVANLAHFDLAPGNIRITQLKDGSGTLTGYTINILFRDSSGLLLGPAFNEAIRLTAAAGNFGPVVDNLDGSYTLTLTGIGSTTDPNIGIVVNGHNYYNGAVSQLGSGAGGTTGGIFGQWWFWLIIVIILIILFLLFRKK